MKRIVLAALLLVVPRFVAADELRQFKQLAGPPGEMASMAPARPADSATRSKSAVLPIELTRGSDGRWTWRADLAVERPEMRIAVMAGDAGLDSWRVSLGDTPPAGRRRSKYGPAQEAMVPADVYEFESLRPGHRELLIESAEPGHGMLIVEGQGPVRLVSHLAAFNQRVGQRLGVLASIEGSKASITSALLRVTAPDGRVVTLDMSEDGDGRYGAEFLAERAGMYKAQVLVTGEDDTGAPFVRTAEHLIPVVPEVMSLRGEVASAAMVSARRLGVTIPVATHGASGHYRLFAEVWGSDGVPVGWIGGMSDLVDGKLTLGLDTRWIALAGARAPFELRNVRIEEPHHFITVASAARMPLHTPPLDLSDLRPEEITVDEEMLMGPRPARLRAAIGTNSYTSGTGHKLLLIHGYCSSSVWGNVSGQFTNAAIFQDLYQNRSLDTFADLILNWASSWNSYAIIAHSQGGMAALHLYNTRWSGLDNAGTGRLIQSVGTPYQGTNIAGNWAAFGQIFGAGCGENTSLTYAGAASWLAGISSTYKSKVNYYTTSFLDDAGYDYCHAATDLLLTDPDDGVIEQVKGQLSGGVNRGHTTGQCHSDNMREPAQFRDSSRNATMNANAAVGPPVVVTLAATGIGQTSATLNGTVNPSGASTTTGFDYGTSTSYGSSVAAQTRSGFTTQSISATIPVQCGRTYYFRAKGTNWTTRYGAQLSFATPQCACTSFSIGPASTSPGSGSGSTPVAVIGSPSGCVGAWSASSNAAWIGVSPTSGNGSGSVTVSWSQNSGAARSGTASIAGNTFTVNQGPGACTSFSIHPTSASPNSLAGSQSVTVTGSPAGCQGGNWSASGNGSWLTVSPASGSGSGSVTVSWSQNNGGPRSATATIANQQFPVSQGAQACAFSASIPPLATTPAAGSALVSLIATPNGCVGNWSASSNAAWLTVSPASGSGGGTVTVSWTANPSTFPRSATVTIAGAQAFVTQPGSVDTTCTSFSIDPTFIDTTSAAGSRSVSVTGSPAGCLSAWSASGNGSWLSVSPAGGTGSGAVTVSWTQNDTGSPRNGTAFVAGIPLNVAQQSAPVTPTVRRRHDFDGDGRSDLLWRNIVTGENYVYAMNGAQVAASAPINVLPTAWGVAGTGDTDGDGKADIVWQSGGEVYLYRMSGSTILDRGYIVILSDLSWRIVAMADFNGDGRDDILWRHALTGENYLYLMNGRTIAGAAPLPPVADLQWSVAAAADFNGDGKADLFWRHQTTGQNNMWLMDGATQLSSAYVNTVPDPEWRVAGAGDFTGDGKADLLWKYDHEGYAYLYTMNGPAVTAQGFVADLADTLWRIAALGDYDGDGRTDIVWRHALTGENYLYLMNGSTIAGAAPVRTVPDPNWRIQNK